MQGAMMLPSFIVDQAGNTEEEGE